MWTECESAQKVSRAVRVKRLARSESGGLEARVPCGRAGSNSGKRETIVKRKDAKERSSRSTEDETIFHSKNRSFTADPADGRG
jgi:hypothetical protein